MNGDTFGIEYETVIVSADQIRPGDTFPLYGRVERISKVGGKLNCYDRFDQRIAQIPTNSTGWHMRREVTRTCPGCGAVHLGQQTGTEWCLECCEAALVSCEW